MQFHICGEFGCNVDLERRIRACVEICDKIFDLYWNYYPENVYRCYYFHRVVSVSLKNLIRGIVYGPIVRFEHYFSVKVKVRMNLSLVFKAISRI